jgi:hypothetical protein
VCSYSDVVLQTMKKTIKHTIVYPSLGHCYKVIALHPMSFVLKMKNSVIMGAESSRSLLRRRGECSCDPLPKG